MSLRILNFEVTAAIKMILAFAYITLLTVIIFELINRTKTIALE